jgi:hypothetical protein
MNNDLVQTLADALAVEAGIMPVSTRVELDKLYEQMDPAEVRKIKRKFKKLARKLIKAKLVRTTGPNDVNNRRHNLVVERYHQVKRRASKTVRDYYLDLARSFLRDKIK